MEPLESGSKTMKADKQQNEQAGAEGEQPLFDSALGAFKLLRYPHARDKNLRAWDAADEFVLQYIVQEKLLATVSSLLLVNDAFGGLTIPLSAYMCGASHRTEDQLPAEMKPTEIKP